MTGSQMDIVIILVEINFTACMYVHFAAMREDC